MNIQNIQEKLMQYRPQLKQKRLIIQYYVSLQFPEKQRKIIYWWSQLIDAAIQFSRQIYMTPSDLQLIFTIHGLKPVPLKTVLGLISQTQKFQWRDRNTIEKIKNQQQTKSWISTILSVIIPQKRISSKLSKHQSITDNQSKIISTVYLTQQLQKIKDVIKTELDIQKNIQYDYIVSKFKTSTYLSNKSIDYLVGQLENKQYLVIQLVSNKKVILYSDQLSDYKNKNWIEKQKIKFSIKVLINSFKLKIDQKNKEELKKMQQAKFALQNNNKTRAKQLLIQVKQIQKLKQNLQNRLTVIQQKLHEVELNQIDQITIQIVSNSHQILKKNSIDPQAFEAIRQKSQQIKMQQNQMNMGFNQLNDMNKDDDIEDQVDNLFKQLQRDVAKSKKDKQRQTISHKFANKQEKDDDEILKKLQFL